jgi:hypothetical protein
MPTERPPTARERRDEEQRDWTNKWSAWDLGTLPSRAHRETNAIDARYETAVKAEKDRVAKANAAKMAGAAKARAAAMDKARANREALKRLKERQGTTP